MKILGLTIPVQKMSLVQWAVFVLAALGFIVLGRYVYHKIQPEEPYTIEIDV